MARLVTEDQTAYVLLGDTLCEIRDQLPPGLDVQNAGRRIRRKWWKSGLLRAAFCAQSASQQIRRRVIEIWFSR